MIVGGCATPIAIFMLPLAARKYPKNVAQAAAAHPPKE